MSTCICHSYSEDMGGGHYDLMLEPNPDCTEHFPKDTMSTENIEVIALGEDGPCWLVTGTTDAHSAEEAARQHDKDESTSGAGYLDPLEPLTIEYRKDFVWRHGGLKPSRTEDDELLTGPDHFEKYAHEARRVFPFAGFLVTL